jgi:isopenicillin N synthase-like dioxygenase
MSLTVSDKQLQALEGERLPVVLVRHSRTRKGYAVIPEKLYDYARPIFEYMAKGIADSVDISPDTWTDAKNARRAELIDKKYADKLSAVEEQELAALQEAVCRHQERVAPVENRLLELIVHALEQRAKEAAQKNS